MISALIRRPIGVCAFTLAIALLGVMAVRQLPVSLLPPVELPVLTVRVDQPKVPASQLEERILQPLEDALGTLPGLAQLEGRAVTGAVEVRLHLHAHVVIDDLVNHLNELLAGIRLPEGVERPRILRYDPAAEPMMRLVLEAVPGGPPLENLSVAAHDALVPQLESLPAVASVRLRGLRDQELRIRPDPARMAAAKLTSERIGQAITSATSSRTMGTVMDVSGTQGVSLRGSASRPEDIGRVILAPGITINDVASVERILTDATELVVALPVDEHPDAAAQGTPARGALLLEVLAQADASLVAASDSVRQRLAQIGRTITVDGSSTSDPLATRWTYAGGSLSLLTDRATAVRTAISEVQSAAVEGAILAWLVLLVFLRAFRPSLVVFLAIPLSVVGTFLLMSMAGVGLNLMSLGGLALGIGMLVDTAIVVLEAADRLGGASPDQQVRLRAIAVGVGEVAGALVASCLTSIAVFVPLAFLPGILGRLFYDQAFTVSASHIVSLAVGLALVPTLLALPALSRRAGFGSWAWPRVSGGGYGRRWYWWPVAAVWCVVTALRWALVTVIRLLIALVQLVVVLVRWPAKLLILPIDYLASGGLRQTERLYGHVIATVLHRPAIGLGLFAGAFALGLAFIPLLPVRLMPPSLSTRFTLAVELPRGQTVVQSSAWAARFLGEMRAWRADVAAVALAGEDSTYTAGLNKRGDHEVQVVVTVARRALDQARESAFLADLERLALTVGAVSAAARTPPLVDLGLGSTNAIDLAIRGPDAETLRRLGLDYTARLRAAGCRGVVTSATAAAEELLIVPDPERLLASGITADAIASAVAAAADVKLITGFIPQSGPDGGGDRTLPIRVHGPLWGKAATDLGSLNLGTADKPVPLASVASIVRSLRGGLILHRAGVRIASITAIALPPGRTSDEVLASVQQLAPLPPGYHLMDDGRDAITGRSLAAMGGMLALSVFLVVVLMAIQFESISQPLLVILSVPMAAAGAFPALYLLGHGLDVMSGIGLVVLVGVAVSNAIVLVTTANLRRAQGLLPRDAIAAAGRERLRPILMTTCTSVLGLMPLAIGWGEAVELRAPLAVAVMGGLCSATVLTLISLPSVLLLVAGRQSPEATPTT
ncbi:MAG: efflux RND transporter permease subunit [Planctomycetes bacterium]|nr:efflux RND transporter permease subunit [Planctomycetota bacterium]